jgi:hypothetical protein
MTRRQEQDTRAGILGAAASLAQLATQITDATAEPGETRTVAALVHVNTQRAALACLSLAAHAGRLEGLAAAHAERVAEARAALEAEAVRDARLYAEDAKSGDAGAPEEWAAGAFNDGWEEGGALDRDAAWAVYVAAFMAAVGDE